MLPRDLEIKNLITLLYLASLCGTSFTQNEAVHRTRDKIQESDGQHDVNVTDGDSVTFNCSAIAKPKATVVWLWNGSLIDASNPPKRFVWLQHNSTFVSVDLTKKNQFQFDCSATSDPCTPVTVQWYKMVDQGGEESVYSESPYLSVVNGTLTLRTEANCSDTCYKYLGEYKCVADNNYTQDNVTVMLTVTPKFKETFDGPRDVNVTERDSITFNCSTVAKPNANVAWIRNGQLIDVNNAPEGFMFSENNRSLTIRDVCLNCTDRASQTIQCNASNLQGYVFAAGYLNVIAKTRVTIRGTRNVTVDFLEEKEFVFQCLVDSDPSTPATVRWYKTEPYGDLVRDEKPYVCVGLAKGLLIIAINPKCSVDCAKYLGEYKCVGDNGYSQDTQTITLSYRYRPPPTEGKDETCALWKIVLTVIGLVLFLIGVFLGFHSKRCCAINGWKKEDRRVSNVDSIYDRIRYDSVGIPLEGIEDNGRSIRRVYSMYDQTGYESIDQVLEYMVRREAAWPKLSDANRYDGYESINGSRREAINCRDRTKLVEDTNYDNMKITVEAVTDAGGKIDENRVDGCESTRFESRRNPNLSEQSEVMNTYADLSRQEINSYSDLGSSEDHHYLELCSKEMKPCLDMGQNEGTPYLDMDKKEMGGNFCIISDPILPPTTTAVYETNYLVLKN